MGQDIHFWGAAVKKPNDKSRANQILESAEAAEDEQGTIRKSNLSKKKIVLAKSPGSKANKASR